MNLKKIIREEIDNDMSWISDYQPQKINDPIQKQKVFGELMNSLYELPKSTYPTDIRNYFDSIDIGEFDRIIKKIRNLAIEYKTFS